MAKFYDALKSFPVSKLDLQGTASAKRMASMLVNLFCEGTSAADVPSRLVIRDAAEGDGGIDILCNDRIIVSIQASGEPHARCDFAFTNHV